MCWTNYTIGPELGRSVRFELTSSCSTGKRLNRSAMTARGLVASDHPSSLILHPSNWLRRFDSNEDVWSRTPIGNRQLKIGNVLPPFEEMAEEERVELPRLLRSSVFRTAAVASFRLALPYEC